MSFNAINTATAGLKVTQAAIGVVSQNIANVGTAGYTKRTLTPVGEGVGNSGVASAPSAGPRRGLPEAAAHGDLGRRLYRLPLGGADAARPALRHPRHVHGPRRGDQRLRPVAAGARQRPDLGAGPRHGGQRRPRTSPPASAPSRRASRTCARATESQLGSDTAKASEYLTVDRHPEHPDHRHHRRRRPRRPPRPARPGDHRPLRLSRRPDRRPARRHRLGHHHVGHDPRRSRCRRDPELRRARHALARRGLFTDDPAHARRRHHHGDDARRRHDRPHRHRGDPLRLARGGHRAARHDPAPGPAPARRARGRALALPVGSQRDGHRRHRRDRQRASTSTSPA